MMKQITVILITLLFAFNVISCSKPEEEKKVDKPDKRPDNAYSDYVYQGKDTLDDSKDLSEEAKEIQKEREKMLDDL